MKKINLICNYSGKNELFLIHFPKGFNVSKKYNPKLKEFVYTSIKGALFLESTLINQIGEIQFITAFLNKKAKS